MKVQDVPDCWESLEDMKVQEVSECPICYTRMETRGAVFYAPGRTPVSFACKHSVCILCVTRMLDVKTNMICPICRQRLVIPDDKTRQWMGEFLRCIGAVDHQGMLNMT